MKGLTLTQIEKTAVECLEKTGRHAPQVVVETPKGVVMVVLEYRNNEEKDGMHDSIRKLIKQSNVDRYFYISEAWFTKQSKDTPVMSASRSVNRREMLVICEFKKNMAGKCIMREFAKDDEKIIWQNRSVENSAGDSMLDFFSDPGEMKRRMDAQSYNHNKEYAENFSNQLAKKYSVEFNRCVEAKDDAGFAKLMAKVNVEMEAEVKRLNMLRLENTESGYDEN